VHTAAASVFAGHKQSKKSHPTIPSKHDDAHADLVTRLAKAPACPLHDPSDHGLHLTSGPPLRTPPIVPAGHDGNQAVTEDKVVVGAPAAAVEHVQRAAGFAAVVRAAGEELVQRQHEPGNTVAGGFCCGDRPPHWLHCPTEGTCWLLERAPLLGRVLRALVSTICLCEQMLGHALAQYSRLMCLPHNRATAAGPLPVCRF
jgi:hypothetical protein